MVDTFESALWDSEYKIKNRKTFLACVGGNAAHIDAFKFLSRAMNYLKTLKAGGINILQGKVSAHSLNL